MGLLYYGHLDIGCLRQNILGKSYVRGRGKASLLEGVFIRKHEINNLHELHRKPGKETGEPAVELFTPR